MPSLIGQRNEAAPQQRSPFGYWVMVAFSFLYFFRPGDIIPGLSMLHMARITTILAILALLLGKKARPKTLPLEIKIIFALFGWLILCIPFAFWRSGSAAIVLIEFSKIVIVTLTLILTVTNLVELRRLIAVQALGVALMTIAAAIVNNRMQGRLAGVGDALLSNPNDLAMNVALNWPLCLAFLLTARGIVKKVFWVVRHAGYDLCVGGDVFESRLHGSGGGNRILPLGFWNSWSTGLHDWNRGTVFDGRVGDRPGELR